MQEYALAPSLCLSLFKVEAKHRHPNTFKDSYEGFVPCNFSYGVLSFNGARGILFMICAAFNTQSPQNIKGTLN